MKSVSVIISLLSSFQSNAQTTSHVSDELESRFLNPPAAVKAYVWWHWMGPNLSQSGITKDLEAMKAAGIGGATIFNISSAVQESHAPTLNNPWPGRTYRSPANWEALRFAAAEASHLARAINFVRANPNICQARTIIVYAWNEHDEGGWPCPTWTVQGPDTSRLDAIRRLLHQQA